MPKVNMPRANWDAVLAVLNFAESYGLEVYPLYKEISDQIERQEY